VFVVRLTPVPPDPVTDVLAKPNVPLEVFTLMPMPVEFEIVVEPLDRIPPTVVRLMPVAPPVEEMLPKEAVDETGPESVPFVRFNAWPLPFSVTSAILTVPNPLPLMSGAAFPPVNPRRVLFEPRLIPAPALVMFTIGAPGLVSGRESLPVGGVTPEIEERLAVASCPINFWPLSKVTGPT
jgi:hypothetical protein